MVHILNWFEFVIDSQILPFDGWLPYFQILWNNHDLACYLNSRQKKTCLTSASDLIWSIFSQKNPNRRGNLADFDVNRCL